MNISTSYFFDQAVRQMGDLQVSIAKTQMQIATGQQLTQPSDNPEKVTAIQRLKSAIVRQESYAATLAILAGIGYQLKLGALYYLGLSVAAMLAGYHYTLIRERTREGCFKAFRHNNWFGAAVFAGMVAELNLRSWLR